MKKIDFSKVECETIEGKKIFVEMTKNLANQIFMSTHDIGVKDWARTFYYSEGEFEFDNEKLLLIKNVALSMPLFYQEPLLKLLES